MKVSVDKKEGLGRKLNVEVPVEKVQDAFTKVYKGIQQNANIKGFRKGKAPLSQIRTLYSDRVKQDVLQELVSRAYEEALTENSIVPIGQPQLNLGELDEEQPFEFSAEFEVRPEVEIQKAEGLDVVKEKLNLPEERVDAVLKNIADSHAETTPIFEDRPAQEGDIAKVDFRGWVDDKPLEGGQGEDQALELGSNQFIPGFEEGVVGMKIGSSKNIELSFPEDYHNSEIAGKPVKFEVTLKALERKDRPELNDDLAKKVGEEYQTLDELKNAIKEELTERESQRIEDDLKNRILKTLVEANPVDVPESLQQQQKQRLVEDLQQRMQQQGMPPDQFEEYKKQWDADFEDTAKSMVQSSFLVDTLAKQWNVTPTEQEVDQKIQEQAAAYGVEAEKLKEFYSSPERKNNLQFQIIEQKVVAQLLEKANITEVEADQLPEAVKEDGN